MIYICATCMVKRPPLSPLSAEHRTLLEAIVSPIINAEELKTFHCQWLMCTNCKQLMQTLSNFQQTAVNGINNLKYLLHKLQTEQTTAKIQDTKPSVTNIKIETVVDVTTSAPKEDTVEAPRNFEDTKPSVISIKVEPGLVSPSAPKEDLITVEAPRNFNPLTEEIDLKFEPKVLESENEPRMEFQIESESTVSYESEVNGLGNEQPAVRVFPLISRPVVAVQDLNLMWARQGPLMVQERNAVMPEASYNARPWALVHTPALHSLCRPVEILPMPATAGSEGFEVFTHNPVPTQKPYINSVQRKDGARAGPKKRIQKRAPRVPMPCPHCDKTMSDKCSLNVHIKRIHSELGPRKCDVCGKQCRSEQALKDHTRQCGKKVDPEAYCKECNVQFQHMILYRSHMKSKKHAAESDFRYKCEECNVKFVNRGRLRIHMGTHTGTTYPCDQCDKSYSTKSARKRHVKKKHEGLVVPRNKVCDYCGRGFTLKALLASHINTHTGARPFVCKLCGADFGHQSALYLHGRYKHKIPKKKRNGKDNSVKNNSVNDNSVNDSSVKDISGNDNSVNDNSVKDISGNDNSVNDNSVKDISGNDNSVKDNSVNDSSVKDISGNDNSVNDNSVNDSSVKDISGNDNSVKDNSVNDSSIKDISGNDNSVKDNSVNDSSGNDNSVKDKCK